MTCHPSPLVQGVFTNQATSSTISRTSLSMTETPMLANIVTSPDSGFSSPTWHCNATDSTPNTVGHKSLPRRLNQDFTAVAAQIRLENFLSTTKRNQDFLRSDSSTESGADPHQLSTRSALLERPMYSYMDLIKMAILSSKDGEMTFQEIISWIETHFPFFKYKAKESWKNSVRHNLSLHADFMKIEGKKKGAKWKLADYARKYHMKLPKTQYVTKKTQVPNVSTNSKKGLKPILPKANFALVPLTSIGHQILQSSSHLSPSFGHNLLPSSRPIASLGHQMFSSSIQPMSPFPQQIQSSIRPSASVGSIASLESLTGSVVLVGSTVGQKSSPGSLASHGSSSGVVTTFGSSSGVVTALGSSSGVVTSLGSSSGVVTTFGSSSRVVTSLGSSSRVVTTFGSSSGVVTSLGSSSRVVTTFGSSSGVVTSLGSSSGVVTALGSSDSISLLTSPTVTKAPQSQESVSAHRPNFKQQTGKVSSVSHPRIILGKSRKSSRQRQKVTTSQTSFDNRKSLLNGSKYAALEPIDIQILDGDSKQETKIVFHLKTAKNSLSENQFFTSSVDVLSPTFSPHSERYSVENNLPNEGQKNMSNTGNRLTLAPACNCRIKKSSKQMYYSERRLCCNTENEPKCKKLKLGESSLKGLPLMSIENISNSIKDTHEIATPVVLKENRNSLNSARNDGSLIVSSKQVDIEQKNTRSRRKQILVQRIPDVSPPKIISSSDYNKQETDLNMILNPSTSSVLSNERIINPEHCSITPPAGGGRFMSSTPKHSPMEYRMTDFLDVTPDQPVSFNQSLSPQNQPILLNDIPLNPQSQQNSFNDIPNDSAYNQHISNVLDTSLPDAISLDLSLLDSIETYLNGNLNESFQTSRFSLTQDLTKHCF
ncbi:forkhead box protein P1 [Biomphalaria pfeifferi]|uniref:Forkhead box protein P1 n=1 Tax=Biomphalaria pfeifferi TaxID=112525 RepID=A0AAD8FMC2_BIOPF|nr:forkhead box protein P1 [Biomphalaria pfeifferi]